MSDKVNTDAFDLLCYGDPIGKGQYRTVWQCRLDKDMVVKVERDEHSFREFHNVKEYQFWIENQHNDKISKWLAPIEFISPDGFILIQRKVSPVPLNYKVPDKLPSFLTDIKRSNFGMIDDRLVCIDYAYTTIRPSLRLKKVEWSD